MTAAPAQLAGHPAQTSLARGTGDDEVAPIVDGGGEPGMQRQGRAVLLDDRGTGDHRAGRAGPRASRPWVGTKPTAASKQTSRNPDGAVTGARRLPAVAAQVGRVDAADAGDPQVHPLDLLARPIPEAVAVKLLVRVVERGHRGLRRPAIARTVRHRHPHLEGLAEVAQVGGAHEALLRRREALRGQCRAGARLEQVEFSRNRGHSQNQGR